MPDQHDKRFEKYDALGEDEVHARVKDGSYRGANLRSAELYLRLKARHRREAEREKLQAESPTQRGTRRVMAKVGNIDVKTWTAVGALAALVTLVVMLVRG